MAKKKRQTKYLSEYRKERNKLLRNVRSLEKRGYNTSAIVIPEIPDRAPRASDIKRLKNINAKRYDLATKVKLINVSRDEDNPDYQYVEMKAKRARGYERRQAARKANETKFQINIIGTYERLKYREYQQKEKTGEVEKGFAKKYLQEAYQDWEDYIAVNTTETKQKIPYELPHEDTTVEPISGFDDEDEYYGETDEYIAGITDTGFSASDYEKLKESIKEPPRPDRLADITETRDVKYPKVMTDLYNLSAMSGIPKRYKNRERTAIVADNAQHIMEQFTIWADEDPDAFFAALSEIEHGEGFEIAEFMYKPGGYERYLAKYKTAMKLYHQQYDNEEGADPYPEQNELGDD